jgi:autotransporter-associated beta strand protein
MLFFVAACASAQRTPTTVEDRRPRRATIDSAEQLSERMARFSTSVAQALNDDLSKPPPSNSYGHQRLLGPRKRLGEPQVQLESTDEHSAFASTNCSGWLSFALNTVSPLHEAVLQSQRRWEEHNRVYSEGFALRESRRAWSRAFVVAQYLRSDHAKATGFEPVTNFEELRPGDIGAYAMGRYAKPSNESRPTPVDTGHVFVVVGPPTVIDPTAEDYDGRGTLQEKATKVIAVPVVDSSSTIHFDPDSRKNEEGRYSLPKVRPHSRAKAGGVGTGTIWFALSKEGRVVQQRLGPQERYRAVLARAARLRGRISLDEAILDGGGALLVRVFHNSPAQFGGVSYGDAPVHLTGEGGLRLASGRLVLTGHNDFSGGVTVESGDLIVASPTALGVGDVVVRGGSITLQQPGIADSATLTIAEGLPDGSLRLEFDGRNVVRAVQIGDTVHRCGIWGGPESEAMFVDPVFSGPGVLELAAKPLAACAPAPEESLGRNRLSRSRGVQLHGRGMRASLETQPR